MLSKILITLYTALLFLFPEAYVMFGISYAKIILVYSVLMVIYIYFSKDLKKEISLNKTKYFFYSLILFCIIVSVSNIIHSIITKEILLTNMYEILRPILYIMIFYIYYVFFNCMGKYILKILLIFICSNCIVGITQYFNVFDINELYVKTIAPTQYHTLINNYSTPRIIGFTSNPNVYGFFLTLVATLVFYLILKTPSKKILYLIFLLIKINLYMTKSRTAFICCLLAEAILIFVYYIREKKIKKMFLVGILTLILEILLFLALPEKITWRIKQMVNMETVNSWQIRVEQTNEYFENLGKEENHTLICYIIGHGSSKHKILYDNEYVLTNYRYGIIGVIGLILIFITPLLIIKHQKDSKIALLISVIGMSLLYMYPAALYNSYKLFPVVLILFAFCYSESKKGEL